MGLMAVLVAPRAAIGADSDDLAFFEQKIRPVLVKECYSCHSSESKRVKGGLRLDSRAGVLEGGESGPAVVPGKPDESRLIDALRYDGIEMPPRAKLPDDVVADFVRWVKLGAPDPREGKVKPSKTGIDLEAGRRLWAYQQPRRHDAPAVSDANWPRNTVDRFILASLEAKAIKPSSDADRATLIRRVNYDLIGLPPSPEEVAAFVGDESPDAYEKLVDRLLASPHFGERWGRHWLDVARFAESLTLRGFVFKEAWRYRDYVIDAFNADRPYDQFLREQIAGDLLPAATLDDRRRQLVATSFLVLGNTNLEEQDKKQLVMDVVDEQIDTIGKAILGQTIGCARCHDHKFDPIPTRDYYALAGILRNTKTLEHANVSRWLEKPLPIPPEQETAIRDHESKIARLTARIKAERSRSLSRGKPLGLGKGAIEANKLPGIVVDDSKARKVGDWKESQYVSTYIGAGYLHDDSSGKGEKTLTFQPELPEAGKYEVWLAYTSSSNRAKSVPVTILSADGEKSLKVDMQAVPPIDGRFLSLGQYRFERNGQGFVMISNEGTSGCVTADAVVFLPIDQEGRSTSTNPGPDRAEADQARLLELEAELKRAKATGPKRDLAMTIEEAAEIGDTRVHVRGSVHNLGEPAPRGFLRVATYGESPAFSNRESGRRELASWLADESNPLTARVIVNRTWHWLFGAGIVRTTDNFGTTGEAPSHPELLDDLAVRFMEEGWSVKSLVRQLVLSRTYRLSTTDDAQARAVDPENRLLWRMNRRRLDSECLRDTILSVSGQLQLEMGGPTFPMSIASDYGFQQEGTRRSVYAPVFRNSLPELFEVFDFADPSMVVGRRDTSIVTPQALFLMNHPFVIDQARLAARRLLAEPTRDDQSRVGRAYQLVLGRSPTPAESRISLGFLRQDEPNAPATQSEDAWTALFQALFSSADFRFLN
jgi:hypothetical protein